MKNLPFLTLVCSFLLLIPTPASASGKTCKVSAEWPRATIQRSTEDETAWGVRFVKIRDALNRKISLMSSALVRKPGNFKNEIRFSTTPDLKVVEVKMVQASGDELFDTICTSAIESLEDDSLLKFPPTSQKKHAENQYQFSSTNRNAPSMNSLSLSSSEIKKALKLSPRDLKEYLNKGSN